MRKFKRLSAPVRAAALVGAAAAFVLAVIWIFNSVATPTANPTPMPTAVPAVFPPVAGTATPAPTSPPIETPETPQSAVNITRNIPYTDKAARKLDVYAPAEQGDWPVVVVLPGVGMAANSKGSTPIRDLSVAIAEQGAVVYAVGWKSSIPPSCVSWRPKATERDGENLRDWSETLNCAVRFARRTASDYGGNPGQVTVFGHGLGGVLGLWAALAGDEGERLWDGFAAARGGPPQQVGCMVSDVSAEPDAFVGYGAAYALLEFLKGEEHDLLDGVSPETLAVHQQTATTYGEDPELWEVASSYARIGGNPDLRLRLIQGERDSLVDGDADWEMNDQLFQALAGAGYDVTWTVVPGGNLFSLDGESGQAILEAIAGVSGE